LLPLAWVACHRWLPTKRGVCLLLTWRGSAPSGSGLPLSIESPCQPAALESGQRCHARKDHIMGDQAVAPPSPSPALPLARRVAASGLERLIAALRAPEHDLGQLAQEAHALLEEPVLGHAGRRRLQLERFREMAARAMRQTDYYHALFIHLGLDPA